MEDLMVIPRFSLRFYLRTLSQLLANPKGFFRELPPGMGVWPPLCFLLVSSIVFTLASLMNADVKPLVAAVIFMANAVGMVFITSGLGFMVTVLTIGREAGYGRFFAIYAFSAGVTLLASWMPYFLFITEPWKWWLIYMGLTRNLALKWQQALMVIGLSIAILILFFYAMLPFLSRT